MNVTETGLNEHSDKVNWYSYRPQDIWQMRVSLHCKIKKMPGRDT